MRVCTHLGHAANNCTTFWKYQLFVHVCKSITKIVGRVHRDPRGWLIHPNAKNIGGSLGGLVEFFYGHLYGPIL